MTGTGLLTSCLTAPPFLPSAVSSKLLDPGSATPTPLTAPLLGRPFPPGSSSSPEFGLVGFTGGLSSNPCNLGAESPGSSSFPCPPEIRARRLGREDEEEGARRDARVCLTVL